MFGKRSGFVLERCEFLESSCNVFTYWSQEFLGSILLGIFSSIELFLGIYRLGVCVFQCPLTMFCPAFSSEKDCAFC